MRTGYMCQQTQTAFLRPFVMNLHGQLLFLAVATTEKLNSLRASLLPPITKCSKQFK